MNTPLRAEGGTEGEAVTGNSGRVATEMEGQKRNHSSSEVGNIPTPPGPKQPPPDQLPVSSSTPQQNPSLSVSITTHSPPHCLHTSPSHK